MDCSRIVAAILLLCACAAAFAAPSVTIRQADETTLTGTIDSMSDGQLVIQTKNANGKMGPRKVPLQDLAEVAFSPPSPAPATQPDAAKLWRASLTDGTRVTGALGEWTDKRIVL